MKKNKLRNIKKTYKKKIIQGGEGKIPNSDKPNNEMCTYFNIWNILPDIPKIPDNLINMFTTSPQLQTYTTTRNLSKNKNSNKLQVNTIIKQTGQTFNTAANDINDWFYNIINNESNKQIETKEEKIQYPKLKL